jgi:hypothetical protein
MAMNRQEAARVLCEILGECDGSLLMSSVSLSPINQARTVDPAFELKINCPLDDFLRKCVKDVISRNKLSMKELENAVIIYQSKT